MTLSGGMWATPPLAEPPDVSPIGAERPAAGEAEAPSGPYASRTSTGTVDPDRRMVRPGTFTGVVVVLVALAVPTVAAPLGPLTLTLEVWAGIQRTDPLLVAGGTATVSPNAQDRMDDRFSLVGASVIAKTSFLEVGLSFDSTWTTPSTTLSTLAPLAGVAFDASIFRFELLGEWGGHRYGLVAGSGERVTVGFLGVRPGISIRLPLAGSVRWMIGVWGFSRWNLSAEEVAVPAPPGAFGTTIFRTGTGPTLGVAGRLGLEF